MPSPPHLYPSSPPPLIGRPTAPRGQPLDSEKNGCVGEAPKIYLDGFLKPL